MYVEVNEKYHVIFKKFFLAFLNVLKFFSIYAKSQINQ